MSREDEFKSNTNPATKYVTWKSKTKNFNGYDKEDGESNDIQIPLSLIYLKVGAAVKGWSTEFDRPLYSNIVTNTKNEDLRVVCDGKIIVSGKYADIKARVKEAGGHYETKLFALLDGKIVMFEFKGSALSSWFEFAKTSKKGLLSQVIEVKSATDAKKGATTYSFPDFTLGKALTTEQMNAANSAYDEVMDYFNGMKDPNEIEVVSAETVPPGDEFPEVDDNPF